MDDAGQSGRSSDGSAVDSGAGGRQASAGGRDSGSASPGGSDAGGGSGAGPGAGGTGSSGGAAGAGATPAGAGGKAVEADAGSPLVDPRGDERRELVADYCEACPSGPDCTLKLNVEWFDTPEECWDELVASERCSKANDCYVLSGGEFGGGPCLAQRTALDECYRQNVYRGTIEGSVTTCGWRRLGSGLGCEVSCAKDPGRHYTTQCSGPPDGPFRCWCELNGRAFSDSMVLNGPQFFTDTCEAAGQLMADGHCHEFTNCCYTFRYAPEPPLLEQTVCECTSDPTDTSYGGHFGSCEELAASHPDGTVVELCPAYLPHNAVP